MLICDENLTPETLKEELEGARVRIIDDSIKDEKNRSLRKEQSNDAEPPEDLLSPDGLNVGGSLDGGARS